MSDASLIAGEIQDLATSIGEVVAAVRDKKPPHVVVNVPEAPPAGVVVNVPEQAPPVVNVNVPEQAPPVVNVAASAPVIEFKPQVTVPRSVPNAYDVRVTERDQYGYIVAFTIVPRL